MTTPRHALVRGMPDAYVHATRGVLDASADPIDLPRARVQHTAAVQALRELGLEVQVLPASEDHPDCVFVEDTAVIAAGRAVVLRSAHPGRQGEHAVVTTALRSTGLDVRMLDDGTCDGGDVLRLGRTLFVGRSARTDAAGVEALRRSFAPVGVDVVEVPLPAGVLHLKCVCSSPTDGVVVVAEGSVDPAVFGPVRVVTVPAQESYAANTVGVGGRVLVAAGYPGTEAALRDAGLQPVPLQMSEIRRGDGSLTCLSLVW